MEALGLYREIASAAQDALVASDQEVALGINKAGNKYGERITTAGGAKRINREPIEKAAQTAREDMEAAYALD
jgi:hypothetical protein